MADSFFGFDTSINNGDHLLPPEDDDCVENEEEEYDALNDETFGGLGDDTSTLDDWEQQHEQYAEIAEHSKHSEELENSVSRLLLDNGDDEDSNRDESSMFSKSSVWAYTPPSKNGEDSFDQSLISSLQKASKAFIQSHTDSNRVLDGFRQSSPSLSMHHSPKQICTVEELEKSLLKQQQQQSQQQQQQQKAMPRMPPFRQMFQHPGLRMPPQLMPMGLSGMPAPPPGVHLTPQLRHPHHPLAHHPHSVPPPGLGHPGPPPPGHFLPPPPALRHPGLIYPPAVTSGGAGGPFPPNHPFNFQQQQQQRSPGQQPSPQQRPPQPQLAQQILQQIQQRQQQEYQLRRNDNNFQQMQQQRQHQQQQFRQQQQQQQQQHGNYQQQQQQHQHYQQHHHHHHHENVDEYAGLMTSREKQWLLNIQLLQLNTGTPYFDDYYYTVFKERKAKLLQQQQQQQQDRLPIILDRRFPNHNQRNRHNSGGDRNSQDDSGAGKTLTPKIYTPLQFENSLGKLQCGSVTAPRKIIDMDVVGATQDGSGDGNNQSTTTSATGGSNNTSVVSAVASTVAPTPLPYRDTRRTKQLLLELEVLYGLLLKAEDLRNPMAISNMEKLREIKQKQRLRELELAPTPEQKQEVLRLFKQESEPVVENQHDYIARIVAGVLQEDKFSGYLAIRKGKMLVLRLLPHLFVDNSFAAQLQELWTRTLLGIPFVGRRDTSGDNILPKLLPFFKRYVQNCSIADVLDVVNALNEVIKQQPENSRMTPLSHQGRAPLYFVLLNRFGVSALVTLLIRTEYLISSDSTSEKQAAEWASFLSAWAELSSSVPSASLAQPLEPIPLQIFAKHCNRFANMTAEKRQVLERHLVENV